MYSNLEKFAADTDVLRRFARRHIWNAPHRDFGRKAESAMTELREARRALRDEQRASARWASSPDGAQRELAARAERHQEEMKKWERERQAALDAWAGDEFQHRRQLINDRYEKYRTRAQKFIEEGDTPAEAAEWLAEQRGNLETSFGPLRDLREAPVLDTSPPMNPHKVRIDTEIVPSVERLRGRAEGLGSARGAHYDFNTGRISLHGRREGSAERLLVALHENNERQAAQRIERALGRRYGDSQGPMPRFAADVLPRSSHMTPSVPLRDINIANTAWGNEAAGLQDRVRGWRLIPRENTPKSEIAELADRVPGAGEILRNAQILPGASVPQTPRYVQHAQQRLIGAAADAPPSPAVQQRLQQIVDTHQASVAPLSNPRLNRNELHMIDSSFHRTFNPEFPQLLAKRVPSPQAPATVLPMEQRDAFREALAAQPGLTRKQFLAQGT